MQVGTACSDSTRKCTDDNSAAKRCRYNSFRHPKSTKNTLLQPCSCAGIISNKQVERNAGKKQEFTVQKPTAEAEVEVRQRRLNSRLKLPGKTPKAS